MIEQERVKRAGWNHARDVLRQAYIWADTMGEPPAMTVEIVASALAAAEARGKVEGLKLAGPVIAAARCIRHWHDRADGGMVVSGEHVFALWERLSEFDAACNALQSHRDKTGSEV